MGICIQKSALKRDFPFIKRLKIEDILCWPDLAPAHYKGCVVEWPQKEASILSVML
jgi:hypothetical protein